MPISKESILNLFHEEVKRPMDPAMAEKLANLLSPIIDELNSIEPAMFVQPSLVFQSTHSFMEGCEISSDGKDLGFPPSDRTCATHTLATDIPGRSDTAGFTTNRGRRA